MPRALVTSAAVGEESIDQPTTRRRTWRYPVAHVARYLTAIKAWGYTLADIEREAINGRPEPEDDDEAEVTGAPGEGAQDDQPGDAEPGAVAASEDVDEGKDLADGATDALDLTEYEEQD